MGKWLAETCRNSLVYFTYKTSVIILCLWFHVSLIYINNCPTRCNTKQSISSSASSLYMFRVSTKPIIRSTQNCNYSLRCWSNFFCAATFLQRGQASLATLEGGSYTKKFNQHRGLYYLCSSLRPTLPS